MNVECIHVCTYVNRYVPMYFMHNTYVATYTYVPSYYYNTGQCHRSLPY